MAVAGRSDGKEDDAVRVATTYGISVTRDSAIYGAGVASLLPFGLVSLAVTTRYLDPSAYGRLATLFATAALLTLVAGMGVLQGTLQLVYHSGDDGADGADATDDSGMDVDDLVGPDDDLAADEKRRLLGSGIVFTMLQAGALNAVVALAAAPIAGLLLGDTSAVAPVRWMALSAWAGSVWRMVHQLWRMERRPVVWLSYQIARPAVVVAATVVVLALGVGLTGPLLATAGGTCVPIAVSLIASRHMYSVRPRSEDYARIWARGRGLVPIQMATVVQGNAAVLLVAALAPPSTVGVFTVALRIAQIPAFFAHGVLLGWPTFAASPIGMALTLRKPTNRQAASVFTLLFLGTLALLVLVSLGASGLVRIAAGEYAGAADYVPLLAAAAAGLTVFRAIYRGSRFPYRRFWYVALHFFWVIPYILLLVVLAPVGPSWSVAAAELGASTTICVWIATLNARSATPTPFAWRRLGLITAVAVACIVAVDLSGTSGVSRVALFLLVVGLMPLLLVKVGALSRYHARLAKDILAGLLPQHSSAQELETTLGRLRPAERAVVSQVVWERRGVDEAATRLGTTEALVLVRLVRGLRGFMGGGRPTEHDTTIGRYLLSKASNLERDEIARRLAASGVDPLELHLLQRTLLTVRRTRRRGTRALDRVGGGWGGG